MSKRDHGIYLRQILRYSRQATTMAQGRTRSDLERDEMFQLALTRLIEIIGEAASRVSWPTRQKHLTDSMDRDQG